MDQNPSREAPCFVKTSPHFMETKVHRRAHNSPQRIPILSHTNPVPAPISFPKHPF